MKMDSLGGGQFVVHLDREEHLYVVECLRFTMWFMEPKEFSPIIGWDPAVAYACLENIASIERTARAAGQAWIVHPERLSGPLSLSDEGDPTIVVSISGAGSEWTVTWGSLGAIVACVDKATFTAEPDVTINFAPMQRERGQALVANLHAFVREAKAEYLSNMRSPRNGSVTS
jgi:hypothetical protein